jgi:hypothetical protein
MKLLTTEITRDRFDIHQHMSATFLRKLHLSGHVAFQMAEVAIPRNLFADILQLIAELRPPPDAVPVKHSFVMRHGQPTE